MRWRLILAWVLLAAVSCGTCSEGEYLDSSKVCQQCDISCATCYSSDGCATCYDQMYMVSRGNMVICDICYNINKGCTTCQTASKCTRCSNGYYLMSDATCAACSSLTPHCLLCNTNGTLCLSCESPYQIVSGVCWKNSTAGDSSGGQISISPPVPAGQVGGSEAKAGEGAKSKCESNYVDVGGNCFIIIPYCVNYSPSGSCLVCVDSYTLNQGYCLPAVLMAAIAANQAAASSQSSAAAQTPPNSGSAPSLPPCASNQYVSNGECVSIGRQCLSFTSEGKCLACDVGFSVYNGLCIQSAPAAVSNPQTALPPSNPPIAPQNDNSPSAPPAPPVPVDPACVPPCATCQNSDPKFCLSCALGFATVDEIPGQCFNF